MKRGLGDCQQKFAVFRFDRIGSLLVTAQDIDRGFLFVVVDGEFDMVLTAAPIRARPLARTSSVGRMFVLSPRFKHFVLCGGLGVRGSCLGCGSRLWFLTNTDHCGRR
jgi:hypothetical protein